MGFDFRPLWVEHKMMHSILIVRKAQAHVTFFQFRNFILFARFEKLLENLDPD